jgi:hypothetical protein
MCFRFISIAALNMLIRGKGKDIPVAGGEDPEGCETSRIPHLLDSRLTCGGEFVSLKRKPPSTPGNIPGTYLC